MKEFERLVDLHRKGERQGPGGEAETKRALELAQLDRSRPLKIADIGCGTGAATVVLARELDAEITAVDLLPDFLEDLQSRAVDLGVADRITTLNRSMEDLPFGEAEFDVIWSEGAVYNMGFEAGIAAWRRFLKPGGKLIVSEITWLTSERPPAIQAYWEQAYREIDLASAKLGILEQHGFSPLAYFALPAHCWRENYYWPLRNRFGAFLDRHGHAPQATAIVEAEEQEIALYEEYGVYYGYGVYVASRSEP
ncbi:MAG: methyltransferase domain-containing protein [Planctomycetes bacterium]|nr:methyltransferase domain-containing protein [Planctomycetota bacterium]